LKSKLGLTQQIRRLDSLELPHTVETQLSREFYFDGPGDPAAVALIDLSIEYRDDRASPIEGASEISR